MDREPFVWTFPTYLLARNYTKHPTTGIINIDDEAIEFYTPEGYLAVFSDSHLAELSLKELKPELGLRILTVPTPRVLQNLLLVAQKGHSWIAVDPNPQSKIARLVSLADILDSLQQQLGDRRGPN